MRRENDSGFFFYSSFYLGVQKFILKLFECIQEDCFPLFNTQLHGPSVHVLKGKLACAEKMPVKFSLDLPVSVIIQSTFRLLYIKFNELQRFTSFDSKYTSNWLNMEVELSYCFSGLKYSVEEYEFHFMHSIHSVVDVLSF